MPLTAPNRWSRAKCGTDRDTQCHTNANVSKDSAECGAERYTEANSQTYIARLKATLISIAAQFGAPVLAFVRLTVPASAAGTQPSEARARDCQLQAVVGRRRTLIPKRGASEA